MAPTDIDSDCSSDFCVEISKEEMEAAAAKRQLAAVGAPVTPSQPEAARAPVASAPPNLNSSGERKRKWEDTGEGGTNYSSRPHPESLPNSPLRNTSVSPSRRIKPLRPHHSAPSAITSDRNDARHADNSESTNAVMSGTQSGRKRRSPEPQSGRIHSLSPSSRSSKSSSIPPGTQVIEIADDEVPQVLEREGVATSFKRIKLGKKTTADEGTRQDTEETPGTLKKRAPSEEVEQKATFLESPTGSPETTPSTKTNEGKSPKKRSTLLNRYNTSDGCVANFGQPDGEAVRITSPTTRGAMVVPGGPRRHGSHVKQITPSFQGQEKKKVFDLTGTNTTEPPRKRQKMSSPSPTVITDADRGEWINADRRKIDSQMSAKSSNPRNDCSMSGALNEGVSEFKNVEHLMKQGARLRIRKDKSIAEPGYSRGLSNGNFSEIEEIDHSDPEQYRPYTGNALRAPPRPKDSRGRLTKSGSTGPVSRHFPSLTASAIGSHHAAPQDASQRTRQSDIEIIDDEKEQQPILRNTGRGRPKQDGGVMAQFKRDVAKSRSESLSDEGDIPPTKFKISRRKPAPQPESPKKFDIVYIQATKEQKWPIDDDDDTRGCLRELHGTFDFYMDNHPTTLLFPALQLIPHHINKITYADDSQKIIVYRSIRNETRAGQVLLIELDGRHSSGKFVRTLLNFDPSFKAELFHRDKVENVFERRRAELDTIRDKPLMNILSAGLPQPEDVRLIEANKERRNANQEDSGVRANRHADGPHTNTRRRLRPESPPPEHTTSGQKYMSNERRLRTRAAQPVKEKPSSPLRWSREHPEWKQQWQIDSLVYPAQGKNQALVDMQDIERLDEGEFLNDNLVMFFLRYLQHQVETDVPETARRVHLMNTFFYPKLRNGKGRSNIDYDSVKRWFSKVNLFEYDYIVVPINESAHWYLAIICNAPKLIQPGSQDGPENNDSPELVQNPNDVVDLHSSVIQIDGPTASKSSESPPFEAKVEGLSLDEPEGANHGGNDHSTQITSSKSSKGRRKPGVHRTFNPDTFRIVTLDSLDNAHSPVCSNLRDFLFEEAKTKFGMEISFPARVGMTAKNIPHQDNFSDCGLFLLHYVDKFLRGPDEFMQHIGTGERDPGWPVFNASEMRVAIRNLIFQLQQDQYERQVKEREEKKAIKAAKKKEASAANTATSSPPQASNKAIALSSLAERIDLDRNEAAEQAFNMPIKKHQEQVEDNSSEERQVDEQISQDIAQQGLLAQLQHAASLPEETEFSSSDRAANSLSPNTTTPAELDLSAQNRRLDSPFEDIISLDHQQNHTGQAYDIQCSENLRVSRSRSPVLEEMFRQPGGFGRTCHDPTLSPEEPKEVIDIWDSQEMEIPDSQAGAGVLEDIAVEIPVKKFREKPISPLRDVTGAAYRAMMKSPKSPQLPRIRRAATGSPIKSPRRDRIEKGVKTPDANANARKSSRTMRSLPFDRRESKREGQGMGIAKNPIQLE